MKSDTIVAVATPPGRGGVGIIRMSGHQAVAIAKSITKKNTLSVRCAQYSPFYDENNTLIDEGLLLFFKAPYSFTGEDVIEFQAHGSPVALDKLLRCCVAYGARLAKPGEFTERAFLNDKMDLTQAEAISDLIHASSETAARMAMRSLKGDFSKKINALNKKIIYLRTYVEAAVDFSEEDIDFLHDGKIQSLLCELLEEVTSIRATATQGAILREGLSVVIAGRPNAGKSTLINRLAQKDIAIVTHVAGTTRDVMRESVLIDDIPVHLVDTAGLRDSNDPVEQEGIKRAWHEVHQADCVLLLMDLTSENHSEEAFKEEVKQALPVDVPILHVFNKIDVANNLVHLQNNAIYISAQTGEGITLLKEKIKEVVGFQPSEGQFLARRRHLHALDKAKNCIELGQEQLLEHHALELLAFDLREAHQHLTEITGEFTTDDLLGEIFSSFCIGK